MIVNIVVVVEALVIDVLTDVELIGVGVIVIPLKVALSESYAVGVPADMAVAVVGIMLGVPPERCVEVLADVNANAFVVVITAFEFPVSTPLEEFIP